MADTYKINGNLVDLPSNFQYMTPEAQDTFINQHVEKNPHLANNPSQDNADQVDSSLIKPVGPYGTYGASGAGIGAGSVLGGNMLSAAANKWFSAPNKAVIDGAVNEIPITGASKAVFDPALGASHHTQSQMAIDQWNEQYEKFKTMPKKQQALFDFDHDIGQIVPKGQTQKALREAEEAKTAAEAAANATKETANVAKETSATLPKIKAYMKSASEAPIARMFGPVLKGADVGMQGMQAYKRFQEPGIRSKIAGGLNVLGAGLGGLSYAQPEFDLATVPASILAEWAANKVAGEGH